MTKQEIIDYKVIPDSIEAKERFNRDLENGTFVLVGDFRNDEGELFVVFQFNNSITGKIFYVTGDEFGWELGNEVDLGGNVFSRFLVNTKEAQALAKIVGGVK